MGSRRTHAQRMKALRVTDLTGEQNRAPAAPW